MSNYFILSRHVAPRADISNRFTKQEYICISARTVNTEEVIKISAEIHTQHLDNDRTRNCSIAVVWPVLPRTGEAATAVHASPDSIRVLTDKELHRMLAKDDGFRAKHEQRFKVCVVSVVNPLTAAEAAAEPYIQNSWQTYSKPTSRRMSAITTVPLIILQELLCNNRWELTS